MELRELCLRANREQNPPNPEVNVFTCYKMFLFWANRHTGHKAWWMMFAFGLALITSWLVAFANLFVPPLYMKLFAVSEENGNAYFLSVFFGIAIAKIGVILMQTGGPLARGYIFICPPPGGILNGDWIKP